MLSNKNGNKFDSRSPSGSVFFNRVITKEAAKILNIPLKPSQALDSNLLEFCQFSVTEDGYYNVNLQLCIKQSDIKNVKAHFMLMGLCEGTNHESNFKSVIVDSDMSPEYLICDNLNTTMELKNGVNYSCWCQFSSDCNSSFSYMNNFSHLVLYKL